MQTPEMIAAQERQAGPRLVAASLLEAQSHAAFFASVPIEGETPEGAVHQRHAHNLANIACGWITEGTPRYLASFIPAKVNAARLGYVIPCTIDIGHAALEGWIKPDTDYDTRFPMYDEELGEVNVNGWLIEDIDAASPEDVFFGPWEPPVFGHQPERFGDDR